MWPFSKSEPKQPEVYYQFDMDKIRDPEFKLTAEETITLICYAFGYEPDDARVPKRYGWNMEKLARIMKVSND